MIDVQDVHKGKAQSGLLRSAAFIAKTTISCVLIAYLFWRYAPARADFAAIEPGWCALALLPLLMTLIPTAERWHLILRRLGADPGWSRLFPVFYASIFFTQVLPSVGGDVVRVLYYRALGTRVTVLVMSVLLDRGLALCAICILTIFAVPQLSQREDVVGIAITAGSIAGAALAAAYIGAGIIRWAQRQVIWASLPSAMRSLLEGISWSLISRRGIFVLLPLSIAVHLLAIGAMYLIGRGLHMELGVLDVFALGPIILLAHVMPISIGGWGVREAAAVFLFTAMGVAPSAALAMSVIFGLLVLVVALPGVFFWLFLRE